MLAIAIAVKATSKGPVLFMQQRAGLGGEPFTFLKFRTMDINAEEKKSKLLQFNERTGPVFKMEEDPRITRLGKHLRKWSLDELPQFINVLIRYYGRSPISATSLVLVFETPNRKEYSFSNSDKSFYKFVIQICNSISFRLDFNT